MKRNAILALLAITLIFGFKSDTTESKSFKCMIQMTNYQGEGAYVVISLINPEGDYERTLYILGDDSEWYHSIPEWWDYFGKEPRNVDGITGATLAGGERSISIIEIDESVLNAGYKLRFETAVEEVGYHTSDVEFPLTTENVSGKYEGTGFIRYVRMIPN
ncbi:MAG: DUF2271 domain-containing protein [Bacteroidetes bacterium]|nr:MAG: DUF2271 domain-containing protein [Bacteroidota bacterium]